MEEFAKQFGVDWRLLVSQMVNFAIVFLVLRIFVYKPVADMLRRRRERIEEGMAKATEADQRLADAQEMARGELKEAEEKAAALFRDVNARAKEREEKLLESSRRKGEVLFQEVARSIETEREKARTEIDREARGLVRDALVRVVGMKPELVDDILIAKALEEVADQKS